MYAAELRAGGAPVTFELKAGRIAYVLCMEGKPTP
jgi:hypothetical protein